MKGTMKRGQVKPKRAESPKTNPVSRVGSLKVSRKSIRSATKADGTMPKRNVLRDFSKGGAAARLNPMVMEYAEVLAHAVDIFGSRMRANSWLNRPSRIFNNQTPLQVLTQDPAAVEEELVRIDEGIFY